jgi:hypothetical protein
MLINALWLKMSEACCYSRQANLPMTKSQGFPVSQASQLKVQVFGMTPEWELPKRFGLASKSEGRKSEEVAPQCRFDVLDYVQ